MLIQMLSINMWDMSDEQNLTFSLHNKSLTPPCYITRGDVIQAIDPLLIHRPTTMFNELSLYFKVLQ